ncbi:RHS repeat-associated core domain-containing protein, partial [Tenacibaculum maritimum]|uniref:RHS repeat domain-containing protein n=1 Tax=Tenacibaculum maritimum TaxID=107401 RepID=UPI00387731CE
FKEVLNVDNGYTYDVNGNMTKDLNKGITNISYNHLNLPTRVTIGGKNIDYTYDAGGVKLSKTVSGVATQYAGNYIYKRNPGRGAQLKLAFFNHPEGYVSPKNASDISQGVKYVYQYKDHLGNVRLSYTDNNNDGVITPSTEIIEESNYYPFGLKHKGYNNVVNSLGNSTAQKFGYNGKELNEELGLEWHDFGARNYDAALGRWMNLDPFAEQMRRHSPYNYAFNNPLRFIDPDGMAPEDIIIWYKDENDKAQKFVFNGNNGDKAPDNKFVQQVLGAACDNINNGEGKKFQALAENSDVKVSVAETEDNSMFSSAQNAIFWNPEAGTETDTGVVRSPASVLEHEADHANEYNTDKKSYFDGLNTPDSNYSNKEEKRVVTGSEQTTARANGEIGKNQVTRRNHKGTQVITKGPTSNVIDRTKTYNYYKRMDVNGYQVDNQLKKYKPKK